MIIETQRLMTTCCGVPFIDTTEHLAGDQWWGRCHRCKEMAELLPEEADHE